MKEERIKRLSNELKYLESKERDKELLKYDKKLDAKKVDIKEIAKEIYHKRGIDYDKLNSGICSNLINEISDLGNNFKTNDKKIRNKMILEVVYIIILLILLKVPFDLVRDVGYEYIELLSTNSLWEILWRLTFLLVYTITLICTSIVLIRNFNCKYNTKKKTVK